VWGVLCDPGVCRRVSWGDYSLEGLDGVGIGVLPPSERNEVAFCDFRSSRISGSSLFWKVLYEDFDVCVRVVECVS
jgi:hypothetical protein